MENKDKYHFNSRSLMGVYNIYNNNSMAGTSYNYIKSNTDWDCKNILGAALPFSSAIHDNDFNAFDAVTLNPNTVTGNISPDRNCKAVMGAFVDCGSVLHDRDFNGFGAVTSDPVTHMENISPDWDCKDVLNTSLHGSLTIHDNDFDAFGAIISDPDTVGGNISSYCNSKDVMGASVDCGSALHDRDFNNFGVVTSDPVTHMGNISPDWNCKDVLGTSLHGGSTIHDNDFNTFGAVSSNTIHSTGTINTGSYYWDDWQDENPLEYISKKIRNDNELADSWFALKSNIFEIESFVNSKTKMLSYYHSFEHFRYYNESKFALDSFLNTKDWFHNKQDKLQLLYEKFTSHYQDLVLKYFGESLLELIDFRKLIAPLYRRFNELKDRSLQLLAVTNRLSKLLIQSANIEDQRSAFRKIYGFLFKNLDDESNSTYIMMGLRKRPQKAFISDKINIKSFCRHERQRTNSGFT